jgi:hypothetical protein
MSLLGVYTIVAYYTSAIPSARYKNKITDQRFDREYLVSKLDELLAYQSDALHWNLAQIDLVGTIAQRALDAYADISSRLGIAMHSAASAERRVQELQKGKANFMQLSRNLAKSAQKREQLTRQPKEKLSGRKGILTIKNYLGGNYYLTSDEAKISGNSIHLVEGKHTRSEMLPSVEDIKDGLIKMLLFSNLESAQVRTTGYRVMPILKLTGGRKFSVAGLSQAQRQMLAKLKQEGQFNGFAVLINRRNLADIPL